LVWAYTVYAGYVLHYALVWYGLIYSIYMPRLKNEHVVLITISNTTHIGDIRII
jgi:hypothetical protein